MNLDNHLTNGRNVLSEIAAEIRNPADTDHAARVVRAVFHIMRERLTLEESFDLISQLPLLIKGMYVDGWQPRVEGKKLRNTHEFIQAVLRADGQAAARDFGNEADARAKIAAVFRVVKRHCSLGEALDISATLPEELRDFWISA